MAGGSKNVGTGVFAGTKIDSTLGILIRSNGCGSPIFHGIHAFEEDPGREEVPRAGERTLLLGAVSLAKLLHLMTALGGGFGRAGVGAAAGDGGDDEFGVTEFRSIRSYCCAGGDDAIGGGVDFYQWWPWPVEKLTEMTVRWRGVFPVVDCQWWG
ncbi:hypothetical protein F0562_004048 [Nyssa sinensis]|uniref:Uncharacterized protein n=1 Tax=Nyssa sinensis TaxID=561372 RepID=A0A5J5BXJ1_9ASTE|nr:hypothetical protein F0562_004048 [Nyssa sinensis]